MAPAIKLKLHNVAGLEELYASIEPSQIQIPGKQKTTYISIYYSIHDCKFNIVKIGLKLFQPSFRNMI